MGNQDQLGRGNQLDKILKQTDSRYTAVIMIGKRARQIVAARQETEDVFDDASQLPVISPGINAVGDATRELMDGKLTYHHRDPPPGVDDGNHTR